jgi:site-specific recombinase XerD
MVTFFIKDRKKDITSIHASVNFTGIKRFTFRLKNIEIATKDWDAGRMITGRGKHEAGRTQSILDNVQSKIEEFYKEYLKIYQRKPDRDTIISFIRSEQKIEEYIKPKGVINIIPEIEAIIKRRREGLELNKGRRFSYNTGRSYGTFLSTIKEFEKYNASTLNSKNIVLEETIYNFEMFLTKEKKFQLNTVGERMKHLNTFVGVLRRKKLIDINPFLEYKIPIPEEETISIALDEDELAEIEALDLSENETYEKVRDQFLLMCWTGLRIGDFRDFIDAPKEGDIITVINRKTGHEAHIPLFPAAKKIIEKYNGVLPKLISEQKMRNYLKVIGGKTEKLKRSIEIEYTKGGKRIKERKPRYKLLGLHTARRTLATTLYRYGISLNEICLITSHKNIKTLKRYLKVTEREILGNVLKQVQQRISINLQDQKDNLLPSLLPSPNLKAKPLAIQEVPNF